MTKASQKKSPLWEAKHNDYFDLSEYDRSADQLSPLLKRAQTKVPKLKEVHKYIVTPRIKKYKKHNDTNLLMARMLIPQLQKSHSRPKPHEGENLIPGLPMNSMVSGDALQFNDESIYGTSRSLKSSSI